MYRELFGSQKKWCVGRTLKVTSLVLAHAGQLNGPRRLVTIQQIMLDQENNIEKNGYHSEPKLRGVAKYSRQWIQVLRTCFLQRITDELSNGQNSATEIEDHVPNLSSGNEKVRVDILGP